MSRSDDETERSDDDIVELAEESSAIFVEDNGSFRIVMPIDGRKDAGSPYMVVQVLAWVLANPKTYGKLENQFLESLRQSTALN